MTPAIDIFWNWFTHVLVVAVPSTALVLILLRWSGQKWIERLLNRDLERFKREQQERLEAFKGDEQKELERLRHLLTSRISKIHEKEFEVLPKAWLMLNTLQGSASRAMELTMQGVPSFETFTTDQLESFLSEPPVDRLSEYQKKEIRNAELKEQRSLYQKAMSALNSNDAYRDHQLLNNYLIENRIFMTAQLHEQFNAAKIDLYAALVSYSLGKEGGDHDLRKTAYDKLGAVPLLINEITQAVQTRLHYGEAY